MFHAFIVRYLAIIQIVNKVSFFSCLEKTFTRTNSRQQRKT